MIETIRMAKSKKTKQADRHKKARMVRVRSEFDAPLDELAEELAQKVTQVVNDAIRERLQQAGKWPPKSKS